MSENGTLAGAVTAVDPDGHALSYAVLVNGVAQPPGTVALAHGTLSFASNGAFVYTPSPDQSQSDHFTFQASDGLRTSQSAVVNLQVNFVNQPPSFVAGASQTVTEATTAVELTVSRWATNIADGAGDPAGQMLNFQVTNDNNSLFAVQPAIDASGNLTFTPAPYASGTANITVELTDNGGTLNGGVITSAPQTFAIDVKFVNQAPSFTVTTNAAEASPTVNELDPRLSGAIATYNQPWAATTQNGPGDNAAGSGAQTLTYGSLGIPIRACSPSSRPSTPAAETSASRWPTTRLARPASPSSWPTAAAGKIRRPARPSPSRSTR